MGRTKILHIISRLPVGGVENLLLHTVKNYDRDRFIPYVCSLSTKGEIGSDIEGLGVELICLDKLGHRFDWSIVKAIEALIREKGIEVVRTDQYHANLYGRLAAKRAGAPCIVAAVHNVYTRDRKMHRRLVNRLFARFTDRVIAVSEAVKRDILRYDRVPEEKVQVIYNGIEVEDFKKDGGLGARRSLGLTDGAPVVGTVGRLVPQKGHKYLIEAISILRREFPDIALVLAGDGAEREGLKAYAASLGIGDSCVFTGTVRDVPLMLSAMDVFAFPSLWEGLGNSVIEAMAGGKAIVASDIPPVREIIASDAMGILTPPKDAGALASAIRRLILDKGLRQRLGRNAVQRASAMFSIQANVRAYESLFKDILNAKRRRA